MHAWITYIWLHRRTYCSEWECERVFCMMSTWTRFFSESRSCSIMFLRPKKSQNRWLTLRCISCCTNYKYIYMRIGFSFTVLNGFIDYRWLLYYTLNVIIVATEFEQIQYWYNKEIDLYNYGLCIFLTFSGQMHDNRFRFDSMQSLG